MRMRLEDLGRIYVLISNILNLDIFYFYKGRQKDFEEYFYKLSKEKQTDILSELIYGLADIKNKLYDLQSIAQGSDDLNEICIPEIY